MLREGGVPLAPKVYIARPDCLDTLYTALFQLQAQSGLIIVHGAVGSGKSVLVAEILNDEHLVYSCFPGGIFWLSIGQVDEGQLLMKMQNLCRWLDGDNEFSVPQNLEEARDRTRLLFAHQHPRSLLVLDDLWNESDVKYFDARVRTVVTTRFAGIADNLTGFVHKVEVTEKLSKLHSRKLMSLWTNIPVNSLPPEADHLIEECGRLPLVISMFGSLLKGHANRWEYYLKQLRDMKISKVKSKVQYQYPSLYQAISVSFDSLPDDVMKSKYEMLAIFQTGERIPAEVLSVFWDEDVSVYVMALVL